MHLKVCKTTTKVSKPILCVQTYDTKSDTHMINMCNDFEVQPIYVRKQPKFPTRERNLAVRRKKPPSVTSYFNQRLHREWCRKKTCQSCKCPREAHAIYQQQTTSVHERLGFKVVSPADSGVEPRDLGYTWVPPGIRSSSRINRYFEQLPNNKVPKIGTEGARYREQQISYQLPKQDLSLQHCKHLEDQYEASYEDFVTARNEISLDIGYVKDAPYDEHCAHCDNEISLGEMVVAAPKFIENIMWHPRCFTCNICNELLIDLTYCVHEDKIYCERHYAELLKPRCAGCDELQNDRLTRNIFDINRTARLLLIT
ncbi:prickle planar cell polarity protein 3-like [Glossina fuscipes]|uniref:Prickle planar cell polarity protein 3-like n=1 Tax=Glossina fuscipes TaxID=7396 RepID=A0A8U0W8S8_9MUSC|nr:prickle planar cell polarity protein 3-like [Glossina fuscipes]